MQYVCLSGPSCINFSSFESFLQASSVYNSYLIISQIIYYVCSGFILFFMCFPSWITSEPSWCRQLRKPIRRTPSLGELMVSWSWKGPCSLRPTWASCPSSTTKPSWAIPLHVARSASKQFPRTHVSVLQCTVWRKLQCNVQPVCVCWAQQIFTPPLIDITDTWSGKWCAVLHGLSAHFCSFCATSRCTQIFHPKRPLEVCAHVTKLGETELLVVLCFSLNHRMTNDSIISQEYGAYLPHDMVWIGLHYSDQRHRYLELSNRWWIQF